MHGRIFLKGTNWKAWAGLFDRALADRIVPAWIERVTSQHPPACHERTFEHAVFVNCLVPIMRTGRVEAAGVRRHCPGKCHLIQTDQRQDGQSRPIKRRARQIAQARFVGIIVRQEMFRVHRKGLSGTKIAGINVYLRLFWHKE
jgi:hypothetical protein